MNNFGNGRKVCNFCGEDISASAKRCPYCGSLLASDNSINSDEVKAEAFDNNNSQVQDKGYEPSGNSFNYNSNLNYGNTLNNEDYSRRTPYQERDYGEGKQEDLYQSKSEQNLNDAPKPYDGGAFNAGEKQAQQRVDYSANNYSPGIRKYNNQFQQGYRGFGGSGQNTIQTSVQEPSISNARKVFITSLCSLIPGFGQLIGVIIAIVYMNSEDDNDKKSFGVALLVNSLIVFVLACILCCLLIAVFSES